MRLLQRYILLELTRVFAFVLSVLTVLLVFVGVFREVTDLGLGPLQVLKILPFVVPSLLPFTIPATLLLTVCVVYGRVSANQEITAAKAAGISTMSMLWPALLLGAVLSVWSLLLTDQVIPWSVHNIQRIVTLAMEDIFLERLRTTHQVIDPQHGIVITVLDVRGKTLQQPTFRYAPHGRDEIMVQGREATLKFDLENQHVTLHIVDAWVDLPGKEQFRLKDFEHDFPLSADRQKPKPRHRSIQQIRSDLRTVDQDAELLDQQRDVEAALALAMGHFDRFHHPEFARYQYRLKEDRTEFAKLRTELHGRFALSCSCFFFALLGSPFSILQARKQFLTTFFLVFVPILLIYYPLALGMMNLSKTGTVNPVWAMWLGNLILLIAGSFVLRKTLQH